MYGKCKAKGDKCKKCAKVDHFAKVSGNNKQNISTNKSSCFTGTRRVHLVTDDGEVQSTVELDTAVERLKDVISSEFLDSIDVFADGVTTS